MNILFMTLELRGLISVGGLAEMTSALVLALRKRGHDVRIAIPYYRYFIEKKGLLKNVSFLWENSLKIGQLPKATVYEATFHLKDVTIPVFLIKGNDWFSQITKVEQVYASEKHPEPYFFLSAAVLSFLNETSSCWRPDVIHCHDYQTGLLPVYLHTVFGGKIGNTPVGTLFTIHNLAFQGIVSSNLLHYAGLPGYLGDYSPNGSSMEYYGGINCMKGAICFADYTSTVSKTYTAEILKSDQGKGLEGVLTSIHHQGRLRGIVNGIDNEIWDPMKLESHYSYSHSDLSGKARAKRKLQKQFGMEESDDPIIAIRSRWSYQKGLELLLYALRIHGLHKMTQIFVVANTNNNDQEYIGLWYELIGWAAMYPNRIVFKYNGSTITHLQYAGSDMLLMPSLYEPCGLVQMEAMRYGTIPIVRKTGGLIDTIAEDYGFMFDWSFQEPLNALQKEEGTLKMMAAIQCAIEEYHNSDRWKKRIVNAMTRNNDWSFRICEYEDLYHKTMIRAEKSLKTGESHEN